MIIIPAIDLFDGRVVRLYKGDYNKMKIYDENPLEVAKKFEDMGATHLHIVDLEGAKNGGMPNFSTVQKIAEGTNLFCEVGGGIRDMESVRKYLSVGIYRVILGTAAVTDTAFLKEAVERYGDKIAVGADIKEGFVAIKGWIEKSRYTLDEFCQKLQETGVDTLICTDISKDGAMAGTNFDMYRFLSEKYKMNIIASGGVSSLDDIKSLAKMNLYGAIVGRAYYEGAIDIVSAIKAAGGNEN